MHVVVVVVVPAFTKGQEGQQETVATVVASHIALPPKDVREGVNEASAVEEDNGADEAPDQELRTGNAKRRLRMRQPSTCAVKHRPKQKRDKGIEAVKENKFWILGEILHAAVVRGEVARAGDPANVRPPEAVPARRVGV